ncbi:hypothetical protein C2E23DRAFT_729053 [Lenzites betulinus]|nr:hypothetical protein C2E23DRAFT_729053 [Lenzites betulinus]
MLTKHIIWIRFAAIFDSLPPDVQHAIVEKQLIPLLDIVNKTKCKRVLASAAKMQRRHASIPVLDLKAKQREVNALLDELHRDAKRSFVKERSHRTELIEQAVESVTSWLNSIWCLVYEHNVDFLLAHRALIFIVNVLDQIEHGRASCRCAFTSMYVPITLKRRSGKIVKSWDLHGAQHIQEILHFIWRDLFLSMLACGDQRHIAKIPEMLDDIEDLMSWTALERLLYGGRSCKCPHDIEEDPDEDPYVDETESDTDEDEHAFSDEDTDLDQPVRDEDWIPKIRREPSALHAKHWSHRISSQMWQFRRQVQFAMTSVFKVSPSLRLYSALLGNSTDPEATEAELMSYLAEMATSCSEVFAATLDIYALHHKSEAIADLLKTHTHLVRPRDAHVLQSAVASMAANPFHQYRALQMIEKELLDTAHATHTALLGPFSLLEVPENHTEIEQILKLRPTAGVRQDRIERWVDAISTPGMNAPNPMALAAMVMGLPIVPAMDGMDDADPLGYLDFDPSDPDLEDMREEFRPRLKQRFEGWSDTALTVKGGSVVLLKVYRELVRSMPFLRANDVVEEMLSRLADKPSKQYLVDAVDALSAFARVQRRKAAAAKSEQKRRANAATQTAAQGPSANSSNQASTSTSTSPSPFTSDYTSASTTPGTPTPPASASTSNGLGTYAPPTVEDEPSNRPETPPPPLEPITPPTAPAPLFTFYTGYVNVPPGAGAGPAGGFGALGPGQGGFGTGGFGGANAQGFGGGFGGGYGGIDDID